MDIGEIQSAVAYGPVTTADVEGLYDPNPEFLQMDESKHRPSKAG